MVYHPTCGLNFMDLPIEMTEKIISWLSYDDIARIRCVNRTLNHICGDLLNKGFILLEDFQKKCSKAVRTKLPRRESERKHHPLARQSEILMAIETRLSLLSMTYSRQIESRHCCFIPGKVLDEGFRALRIVKMSLIKTNSEENALALPRTYEFLKEYRDISSMAMEHFEEKILPLIRKKIEFENSSFKGSPSGSSTIPGAWIPRAARHRTQLNRGSNASQRIRRSRSRSRSREQEVKAVHLQRYCHCRGTRKAVAALQQTVQRLSGEFKVQNILLTRKINQQKRIIKIMKKELKDTRNAMSTINKDLNRLKIKQSSSKKQSSGKSVCTNLSVTVTTSLCVPSKDNSSPSVDYKGVKRKRDGT